MGESAMLCSCDVIHSEVVEAVQRQMNDDRELYDLADFFKVLGDSTRVKILSALIIHEMCVCDLAALLGMTKSAISHQLKALKQANLVRFRRAGKVIYYALSDGHVHDIVEKGLEHIREKD